MLFLLYSYTLFQFSKSQILPNGDNNACTNLYDYPIKWWSPNCYYNPSVMATVPKMIEVNGYNCQIHHVITKDGYNLTVHRILHENGTSNNGRPVFLQHGITADATNWVSVGNRSWAFYLFRKGYDVWLGNFRGNSYSRNHVSLKDSDPKFWNFSADDFALADLPGMLKMVVNKTGQQVIYVGHSLGSATLLMYASEYPLEAKNLVSVSMLMAPTVYVDLAPQMKFVLFYSYYLSKLANKLGMKSIFSESTTVTETLQQACSVFPYACRLAVDVIFGKSDQLLNEDLLLLYSFNALTTSNKLLAQISKNSITQIYQKYDYGENKNLKIYGQKSAPIYHFKNVQLSPVYLFYGNQDAFIRLRGTKKLYLELTNISKYVIQVPINGLDRDHYFSHLDFLFSGNLTNVLYPKIETILQNYPPQ